MHTAQIASTSRSGELDYSAAVVLADTLNTNGRAKHSRVLLQDRGQGKTMDRLALTFLSQRRV